MICSFRTVAALARSTSSLAEWPVDDVDDEVAHLRGLLELRRRGRALGGGLRHRRAGVDEQRDRELGEVREPGVERLTTKGSPADTTGALDRGLEPGLLRGREQLLRGGLRLRRRLLPAAAGEEHRVAPKPPPARTMPSRAGESSSGVAYSSGDHRQSGEALDGAARVAGRGRISPRAFARRDGLRVRRRRPSRGPSGRPQRAWRFWACST